MDYGSMLFTYALILFFTVLGDYCMKKIQNRNQNQSASHETCSSRMQPLLNYMNENKFDVRWTKLSLSRNHYNRDEPRSCHLSPNPFVEVSYVTVSPSRGSSSRTVWDPSDWEKLVMQMKMRRTVVMEGEYEVHAGYYRSRSRNFNLTLVGLEQEITADTNVNCLDGWKILKVGVSTKLENMIFHYDELDKFAFKLPQVEGQCWLFQVPDLARNMTPSEWEVVNSNMVGSLNAALPRGAYVVW